MEQKLLQIFAGADFSFGEIALSIFARQYERCAPYRRFCNVRGQSPASVTGWRQIPHLPVTAFKHVQVYSGQGSFGHFFQTSGTTWGSERRGRHYFERLDLYEACSRSVFKQYVLPDRATIPMLMLARTPSSDPHSSLSWYLARQGEAFSEGETEWFVSEEGLRLEPLVQRLKSAPGPVALLGTAYAFLHLVDSGIRAHLPPGSRLMETGGFKGRSREVERSELYRLIRGALGSELICINQYGMTEISSNCYDQILVTGSTRKGAPAWVKVRILDPESLQELPHGEIGMVAVTDLANLYSCSFLLTQDLGVAWADGFEILGRSAGAEAKGCSIAMDQFLQMSQL